MKSRKVRALKMLRCDASLLNIRRALDELHDIPHSEMARRLNVSRPSITSNINGQRNNPGIQAGIAAMWHVPPEEIFENGK